MRLLWLAVLLGAFELCTAGKILFVLPAPSRSHYILNQQLMERLAEKGHEVTVIAPYKFSKTIPRLTEIVIPDCSEEMFSVFGAHNSKEGKFQMRRLNPLAFLTMGKVGETMTRVVMTHPPVKAHLQSNPKYDLVIGESFMMEGLLAGLAYQLKASLLMTCPSIPFAYVNEIAGNPAPPSYIPDGMLASTDEMTFFERLKNELFNYFSKFVFYNIMVPQQDALMRKYFGDDSPPVLGVLYNNPLILVNHHFSLGFPRPYVPNMIEIGGYHVRQPKPLPKDLEEFITNAKDGVILFSMGSNLRSDEFPKEKFEGILRAFSRLKQRVLWKFETENPPNLPNNVKISKWLPQSDILAHPNMKLFITHGGLLSTTEAVFRGVPVVVIPIFGDQPTNAKLIEKIGVGVKLEYDDIDEMNIFNSVQKILNNADYSKNAKLRSNLLRDRPLSPVDTAVYWIEYAIRHKGAAHLRSGATKLLYFQLEMLDVRIVIMASFLIFCKLVQKVSCCLLRKLKGDKNKNVSTKKKKN